MENKLVGSLSPGTEVANHFAVQRILGCGGMGVVYDVVDGRSGARIALKTILPKYRYNNRAIARFTREVLALRELSHPGIVRIYESGHDKKRDLLYFTMEYIEGLTIREHLLKNGRFSFDQTMRILGGLCEALEYAHRFTVHRDVSPENILITPDGFPRLVDFGLAKVADPSGAPFTLRGDQLGRKQYIPPEQKQHPGNVDQRADVYALAILFFEMVTGDLTLAGTPLRTLRPELPDGCDAFLSRAAALNREERLESTQAFRRELLRIGGVVEAEPLQKRKTFFSGMFARLKRFFRPAAWREAAAAKVP